MSDLGCTCSCPDYEPADVFEEKLVRARKTHECCECGAEISKGEEHEVASGLWEGDWSRYRTCLLCVRIRNDMCRCGHVFGGLRDTLWSEAGFDYVTGRLCETGYWKDR